MYLPTISDSELIRSLGNGTSAVVTVGVCGLVTYCVDTLLRAIAVRIINRKILQKNQEYFVYAFKTVAVISGIAVGCLIAPKLLLVELTARKAFEAMTTSLMIAAVMSLINTDSSKTFIIFSVGSSLVSFGGVPLLRFVGATGALASAYYSNRGPSENARKPQREV